MSENNSLVDYIRTFPMMTRDRNLDHEQIQAFFTGIDLDAILGEHKEFLQIGCGKGNVARQMAAKYGGVPYGVDLSDYRDPSQIQEATLRFIVGNAEHLPYDNEKFDFVFSFMTHRYIGDKLQALKEIHRVMKLGTTAIIDFAATDNINWTETGIDPTIETILRYLPNNNQLTIDKITIPNGEYSEPLTCYRMTINKTSRNTLEFPSLIQEPEFNFLSMVVTSIYDRNFIW